MRTDSVVTTTTVNTLAEGNAAKFLAEAMKLVICAGVVSDERFVEIVPPCVLAEYLADRPEHQAAILLDAQKIPPEARSALTAIYQHFSVETTTEMLTQALSDEGPATPFIIRSAVTYDDWPKILTTPLLWKFISDGDWYKQAWVYEPTKKGQEQKKGRPNTGTPAHDALELMLGLLDKYQLITPRQKYDQIGLEALIENLSRETKDGALRLALVQGENEGLPFKSENLFGTLATVSELVRCIESTYLWEKLMLFVAAEQGWLIRPSSSESSTLPVYVRVPNDTAEGGREGDQPKEDAPPPTQAGIGAAAKPDTSDIFDTTGAESTAAPPSNEQQEDAEAGAPTEGQEALTVTLDESDLDEVGPDEDPPDGRGSDDHEAGRCH